MLFAFAGGLTRFNGDRSLSGLHSHQLLAGSAALIAAAVLCYAGVADRTQFFVGGAYAGGFGAVAALIGLSDLGIADVAAVLVAATVVLAPALPLLSVRLGKLPVPALPVSTDELLADRPPVPRTRVYASVRRSDELLTGMVLGSAFVTVIGQVVLAIDGRRAALVLAGLSAAAMLLQARLYPTVRHRAVLLIAGVAGAVALSARAVTGSVGFRLSVVVPLLLVTAGLLLAAARQYQHRAPGPYLGRVADALDVLIIVSVVPVTCLLVGLVGYMRNLYG